MEGVWSISVELEFASQPPLLPPVLGDEVQHPEEQYMVQYSTVQYSTVPAEQRHEHRRAEAKRHHEGQVDGGKQPGTVRCEIITRLSTVHD